MAHQNYIQIPPDSTGKQIRHNDQVDLELSDVTFPLGDLEHGATIIGDTSGVVGRYEGFNILFDKIFLHISRTTGNFTVGEIIKHGNDDIGTMVDANHIHTPQFQLSDADVPSYTQKISKEGASFVRYSEGDLSFDAFGHAQQALVSKIDDFIFTYSSHQHRFYDLENNGPLFSKS